MPSRIQPLIKKLHLYEKQSTTQDKETSHRCTKWWAPCVAAVRLNSTPVITYYTCNHSAGCQIEY